MKEWTTPYYPKHALNYEPRGRRDRGCPRKRWQRVNAGTGQATLSMEEDDDDDDDDDDPLCPQVSEVASSLLVFVTKIVYVLSSLRACYMPHPFRSP